MGVFSGTVSVLDADGFGRVWTFYPPQELLKELRDGGSSPYVYQARLIDLRSPDPVTDVSLAVADSDGDALFFDGRAKSPLYRLYLEEGEVRALGRFEDWFKRARIQAEPEMTTELSDRFVGVWDAVVAPNSGSDGVGGEETLTFRADGTGDVLLPAIGFPLPLTWSTDTRSGTPRLITHDGEHASSYDVTWTAEAEMVLCGPHPRDWVVQYRRRKSVDSPD